ncbi:hypothetical protein CLV35_1415 [Motilibacter peucedani]|uniref:Uncharacterized protein n=1 Tax=Motilibacter peucedani TaxID=598650 RepID=A0A420XSE3_9ACTN|nr:hypothetical protein [Motilibacter peucedani]RKS77717.1 hypothetical protein CLV35_1415 [Motilibacter peucedani]
MPTSTPAADVEPVALPPASRSWRVAVTVLLVVGAVSGTLWGYDDWWPLAPMKMYATSTDPDGVVTVLTLEARTTDGWTPAPLTPGSVGINRAEAEGQLPRLVADPELLGDLAATHARLAPGGAPWTGLRVVRVATVLHDGGPTGEVRRETLATWTAP